MVQAGFEQANTTSLRRPNDLRIPLCMTSHAQQCVTVRGSRSWNVLSEELKNVRSFGVFKSRLKDDAFSNY